MYYFQEHATQSLKDQNDLHFRTERIRKQHPDWSTSDIHSYIECRDEGYSQYESKLMCGLCDPSK
jgi:hypothetical protein